MTGLRAVRLIAWVSLACLGLAAAAAGAATLRIVAAENVYGDVAAQLAGPQAQVLSVLRNPAADPHLFEPDPATARALSDADLVILNGAGYDPWMQRLLSSAPRAGRQVLDVSALVPQVTAIGNPHLWYDPATMPPVARAVSAWLAQRDPSHAALYQQRLQQFLASLRPLDARIAQLHARYAGIAVTATEPVADDLVRAIGLTMRNERFQLSIMNNTEPGARETAAFEQSLRQRHVHLLLYNAQASDSAVQRLIGIARASGVPVLAVSETEPPAVHYQQWMMQVLQGIALALGGTHP